MSNKEELVFVNCIHEGCKSQRMFLKSPNGELPEYVCTKHRRLHRVVPKIKNVTVKSGFLLKKGAFSSSYTKRVAVLLADRLVIYAEVGDPVALACVNLRGCTVVPDKQIKKRFSIINHTDERKFAFEAVLDVDYADWFYAIGKNIDLLSDDDGDDFKCIDEDDYISPGTPITPETKRPNELKKQHQVVIKSLRGALKPHLLNNVKGDNNKTLSLSIWAGTWNMGECDPPFNLEEWVPNSFDIIAVGVEECMKLPDLEMRCNGVIGSDFTWYEEKVGSTHKEVGFHGYISVIVFIRLDLMMSGLVPAADVVTKNVALGKNLGVARASNKGGVRVRVPLDLSAVDLGSKKTQVDFICCHLASDQKGVSKIAKRNKNAVELVQSLVMDGTDNKGYVFAMGDMNYRIDMAPEDCLDLIVEAVGNNNPDAVFALMDNDQLTPCLATAATFPGFQELTLPTFAPTYKRKRLEEGDPKGYTDKAVVYSCYDHEMADAGATRRTPSFTDRILFQAYPTDIQSMLYIYKYNEIDYIRDSDHSPVYGAVSLRIGPNCNKGHTFKKIIQTVPREEMLRCVSKELMFRVLVNNRGIVEPLQKQLIDDVSEFFSPAYIHRDTIIIKAGDSASSSLLFVVKGSVKLVTEKYELKVIEQGGWFGGEALIDDVSGYTAIAQEDTICLSLSVTALERMIKKGFREYALSIRRMVMGQSVPGLVSLLDELITDYDSDSLNLLRFQLNTTYIEKDVTLFEEGDDIATAFYLIGGQISVLSKTPDGDDKLIAMLGPGAVVGTELLTAGTTSQFKVKTNAPSLLWSLSREAYQTYLTLDEEQQEAAKMYDQKMFHWVNQNQLPLTGMKPQMLKLISELFGGKLVQSGKQIYDPATKDKKISRILISGKGIAGKEAEVKKSDNAFDIDASELTAVTTTKVVNPGCILNQFDEPVRAAQDCTIVDMDKKQLKKLCMLLRWKYFGVGAANLGISKKPVDFRGYGGLQVCVNDLDGIKPIGAVHVNLIAVDTMAQTVAEEEHRTKDVRAAPYFWGESFRFGTGAMGVEVLAAIRVEAIQGMGHLLGEGILPLEGVFSHLDEDGYYRHALKLRNDKGFESTIFLTMKALSEKAITATLDEAPLEDISVSRQPVQPKNDLLSRIPVQIPPNLQKGFDSLKNLKNLKGKSKDEDEEEDKPEKPGKPGKPGMLDKLGASEMLGKLGASEMLGKLGKLGKGGKGEEETPQRPEDEDFAVPPRGRKTKNAAPRYEDEEEFEEKPQRPPRLPQRPPRLPQRPPKGPAEPPAESAPTESKGKQLVTGWLNKIGLGGKKPQQPEGMEPPELPRRDRNGERPRRRYEESDEEFEESDEEFEEEFEESDEEPRRKPQRNSRRMQYEDEDMPRKRKPKARQPPQISSDEEFEEEPIVPEGKPTPFNHGKRIPFIPLPNNTSYNPFAASCGNPFALVGTNPPEPVPPHKPNTAFDAFAPPKEEEKEMPKEEEGVERKIPEPRPDYNPFAAKQKGSLADMPDWRNRRPVPQENYNPFESSKPKPVIIKGKVMPNPFV